MVVISICAVIGILAGLSLVWDSNDEWSPGYGLGMNLFRVGGGLIAGCVVAFFIGLVIHIFSGGYTTENSPSYERHYLVEVKDNLGEFGWVHGGIFGGSGEWNQEQFYSWYERNEDGHLEYRQIREKVDGHIEVIESSKTKPQAIKITNEVIEHVPADWSFPFPMTISHEEFPEWKIIVPVGTVNNDFELNAE